MVHNLVVHRFRFLALVLCALIVNACSPDSAKRFDYGTVLPDFRILVVFSEPKENKDLFAQVENLAHEAGFPDYIGIPIKEDTFYAENNVHPLTFDWVRNANRKKNWRDSISFDFQPKTHGKSTRVRFIYFNKDMDDFTLEEWIKFKEWRDVLLPAAFPGAEFEVVRHPAEYTADENIADFSTLSGVQVPK